MLNALSITIIILTIISAPLVFKIGAGLDVLKNDGYIKLSFFNIEILNIPVKLPAEGAEAIAGNTKVKNRKRRFNLTLTSAALPALSIINIRELDFDAKVGKSDDALFTVFALSSLKAGYAVAASYIKNYQSARVKQSFMPYFDKDIFDCKINGIIAVSIGDIIYGVLMLLNSMINKRARVGVKA